MNLVIVVESVRALVSHEGGETNKLHIPSIIAVAAAFGKHPKFCGQPIVLIELTIRRQVGVIPLLLRLAQLIVTSSYALGGPPQ